MKAFFEAGAKPVNGPLYSAITARNSAIVEFRLKPAQADMALSGYAFANPILMGFKNAAVAAQLADSHIPRLAPFFSPAHRSCPANRKCFGSPARAMLQAKPGCTSTQIKGIVLAR